MKKHIATTLIFYSLCSLNFNTLQAQGEFHELKIERADVILNSARTKISTFPFDVNLYIASDINKRTFQNYEYFPIGRSEEVWIEPEDPEVDLKRPKDYFNTLKSRYDSVRLESFTPFVKDIYSYPCEKIYYKKTNPDIGVFSFEVERNMVLVRHQDRSKAIERIRDTAIFTFNINLADPYDERPKIVSILKKKSRIKNAKVDISEPVVCIEDDDEREWGRVSSMDLPETYRDYITLYPTGRHKYEAVLRRHYLNQRKKDINQIQKLPSDQIIDALQLLLEENEEKLGKSPLKDQIYNLIDNLNRDEEDFRRIDQSYDQTNLPNTLQAQILAIQTHKQNFKDLCSHYNEIRDHEDIHRILFEDTREKIKRTGEWRLENLLAHQKEFSRNCIHRIWVDGELSRLSTEKLEVDVKEKIRRERRERKVQSQIPKPPKTKREKTKPSKPVVAKNDSIKRKRVKPPKIRNNYSFWTLGIYRGIAYERFYSQSLILPESLSELLTNGQQSGGLEFSFRAANGFLLSFGGGLKQGRYDCGNLLFSQTGLVDSCLSLLPDNQEKIWIWNAGFSLGYDLFKNRNFIWGIQMGFHVEKGFYPVLDFNDKNFDWILRDASIKEFPLEEQIWSGLFVEMPIGFGPRSGYGISLNPGVFLLDEGNSLQNRLSPTLDINLFFTIR